ncbi:hypothetical protein B0T17DRAFT_590006 [Bombardia bombarda]|uniref:MARVEL domain-containing protein n=1 Tax=Bombardia bombarda TaxID=252184 RepID=A0AA40C9K7_9PEZI|nr:hypothetical protein B0T17DRAFT_590006 [Bombardia bombarda]
MGAFSRVVLVLLRVWELICSVIVLGILGRFLHLADMAGALKDSRMIYTIVIASISAIYSILFILPFIYAFLGFPVDLLLFVAWLVAFCLLITRTGTATCSSTWYWNYWGFYWGGWWGNPWRITGPGDIGYAGCSSWRTVLAFSFMASIAFLISGILGAIVVYRHYHEKKDRHR